MTLAMSWKSGLRAACGSRNEYSYINWNK